MESLTYADAESKGIDMSMIAACKKIRGLAKLDRLTLDESQHRSGLNKHLFDYIEYCGLDVLGFIKQYLSNLQPYMLERRKDQEPEKSFICVIDNLYRVSLYIKVDNKQFEEVVVSFHENNIRGVAKDNSLAVKKNESRLVPVFADMIGSKVHGENKYIVKVLMQRGLKILPLDLPAVSCQDVFLVERRMINMQFIEYCNDYIKDLYTSDLDLDFDKIEVFSMLQQISFTSYGNDTFSSISLLIDSLCIQSDYNSKTVADFALVTFVQNLQLTEFQKKDLMNLLEQKFLVSSIKGITLILNRIRDSLNLSSDTINIESFDS